MIIRKHPVRLRKDFVVLRILFSMLVIVGCAGTGFFLLAVLIALGKYDDLYGWWMWLMVPLLMLVLIGTYKLLRRTVWTFKFKPE